MNSVCRDCSGKGPITRLRFEKLHPEGWRLPLWSLIQGWVFWTSILRLATALLKAVNGHYRSLKFSSL
jgi:hypothetical protein